MRVVAVIPARYGSTRLPGKPLALIQDKPMIQWVYERAKQAKSLTDIWVATDHQSIIDTVTHFGGQAMMTSPQCLSGTDRVAEVAKIIEAEVYVNIQGDEPLIDPAGIDQAVALVTSGRFECATLMTPFHSASELQEKSVVKVMVDLNQKAVYFSRYAIPYSRIEAPVNLKDYACRKHVGLYVYRRDLLFRWQALPTSSWELAESLEQLRALQNGISIGVAEIDAEMASVDTPEDLKKVIQMIKKGT